jgi:hypothetical protein
MMKETLAEDNSDYDRSVESNSDASEGKIKPAPPTPPHLVVLFNAEYRMQLRRLNPVCLFPRLHGSDEENNKQSHDFFRVRAKTEPLYSRREADCALDTFKCEDIDI